MPTHSQPPAMVAEADDSRITSDKAILSSGLLPGHFVNIINGDCRTVLKELASESIQCVVTSPPYWGLRDYGHADQIGQEETPDAYVQTMRQVFAEVWRVLRDDGTCWLNLGDSYNGYMETKRQQARKYVEPGFGLRDKGLKPKDLVGIPWRVALALQSDGWYLRSDIIWAKPNCMPESVTDRPTRSHEYIFLLTKCDRYYYDHEAIKEPYSENTMPRMQRGVSDNHKNLNGAPGQTPHTLSQPRLHSKYTGQATKDYEKSGAQNPSDTKRRVEESILNGSGANKRTVWHVTTPSYPGAHFATFPPDLIKPCILAGTKPGDVVLDPFGGSGTTGMVALELGRRAVLVELNPEYTKLCDERCTTTRGLPLVG